MKEPIFVQCKKCYGHGYLFRNCSTCRGKRVLRSGIQCYSCRGVGQQICPKCDGHATIEVYRY